MTVRLKDNDLQKTNHLKKISFRKSAKVTIELQYAN